MAKFQNQDRLQIILAFSLFLALVATNCRPRKHEGVATAWQMVKTMPERGLIAAANAQGAPAFHRHLVRPGLRTSYLIRVMNTELMEVKVDLSVSNPAERWTAKLEKSSLKLAPGEKAYVKLALEPAAELTAGSAAAVTVAAKTSAGKTGELVLEAETTLKRKIYFVSIDSLSPAYLALNAKGNGPGRDGDWLTPNIHAAIRDATFFPNHQAHLIAATDMNHAAYLSGAFPGELGIYSVNVFLFGFDDQGRPRLKTTPLDASKVAAVDLMYYGPDGKPVTTIFNVTEDPAAGGNPNAFSAYVSGKPWVPEHYRNPIFGLSRIATFNTFPDYVSPPTHVGPKNEAIKMIIAARFGKVKNADAFLWEDPYTMDQALRVIENEDPEVCYILLGAADAAGHMFGAADDPKEWDDHHTPDDLSDDVSRVNRSANRLGQVQTVKEADAQVGRFIAFLKDRGVYDDSYLIVESDHSLETNFFAGPDLEAILSRAGFSAKKDYFVFTSSQIGAFFARPGRRDPDRIVKMEKALEDFRMKNPLSGEKESPMLALDREEMKTGIDQVTGERVSPPMELYSEYYIEHPQPGGLSWPDLILLCKKNYQFPVLGVGLANIGIGKMDLPLPRIYPYVGGHGGPSTQPALLIMRGPGIAAGQELTERSWTSDVAPTLYALEGYQTPASVQGENLLSK